MSKVIGHWVKNREGEYVPEVSKHPKIVKMEKLIGLLSDMFGLSTTVIANKLLQCNIKSWDNFKGMIEE